MKSKATHFLTIILSILALGASTLSAEDVYWEKDFTLNGETVGESLDLKTLKGKPFIMYWGCINCGRCTNQVDDFSRMSKSLKRKGIPVIAVQSTDVTDDAVKAHIKKHRLQVPYFPTHKRLSVFGSKPETDQLFRGIPRYIVIDGEGKVNSYYNNTSDARRAVEKLVK